MPEIVARLSTLLGVSFASGINLYLTLCIVGVAKKFELVDGLKGFEPLDNWFIIIVSGVLFLVEFVADKLPAVDNLWNAVHSFIRPVAAGVIAIAVVGTDAPAPGWILAGLGAAAVATTTNAAKVGTRMMVAASPEPFSDVVLSLLGDGVVALVATFAMTNPVPTAIVCLVLLAITVYFLPRFWRGMVFAVRAGCAAVVAIFVRDSADRALEAMEPADGDALARAGLADRRPVLVLPANAKGVKRAGRLRRGKLAVVGDQLAFVYRKWFRRRVVVVPISQVVHAGMRRRVFSNLLWVQTAEGSMSFLTTRRTDRRTDHALALLGGTPATGEGEQDLPARPGESGAPS